MIQYWVLILNTVSYISKKEGEELLKYIGNRLIMMIPVMLGVTLIVFSLLYMTPGDPVDTLLGDSATPEAAE